MRFKRAECIPYATENMIWFDFATGSLATADRAGILLGRKHDRIERWNVDPTREGGVFLVRL